MLALPEFRAWSELVAVPSKYVFKLPQGMSALDAAAIGMNYVVAYMLLFELGGLSAGKSVLLHSAGGGVVSNITFSPSTENSDFIALRTNRPFCNLYYCRVVTN